MFFPGAYTKERLDDLDSDEEEYDGGDDGDEGDDEPGLGPDSVQPVGGMEPVCPGLQTEDTVSRNLLTSPHLQLQPTSGAAEGPHVPGDAGQDPGQPGLVPGQRPQSDLDLAMALRPGQPHLVRTL